MVTHSQWPQHANEDVTSRVTSKKAAGSLLYDDTRKYMFIGKKAKWG